MPAASVQNLDTTPIDPPPSITYKRSMPASPLDSDETYARLDSHGLLGRIEALPEQVDEA